MNAWEDPWLPRPADFLPLSRQSFQCSKVSEFITTDRTWNHQLLLDHFEPSDVDLISSLSLSRRVVPDCLIWHYDVKGRFSTKSAYQLCRSLLHDTASSSGPVATLGFWKKLWFAQVPGKIKIHVWRACSAILPTTANLRKKRVFF